jgi:Right handed beta helix region
MFQSRSSVRQRVIPSARRQHPRPCSRPCLEPLEARTVPSTLLFQDTFDTGANHGAGTHDINYGIYGTARQTGLIAPIPYVEPDATAAGGAFDDLTQVNNPALPSTLMLATAPAAGQVFTYVSPVQNFAASGLNVEHLHVAIDPYGPGSSGSTDNWAAIVFGTTAGSSIIGNGTGVLVRAGGEFELWDRSTLVDLGFVSAKTSATQFYTIDFAIDPGTGQYTLSIDGQQLFTGTHGSRYSTNYITLEDLSGSAPQGIQKNYFADLTVSGTSQFGAITAGPNTTFYVSPTGNNHNTGTSPGDAWQSIARINLESFRPGDRILFLAGATFAGNLAFNLASQGSAADPITVGSYGWGTATIDAGPGTGIAVTDASYVTITDLDFVGSGYNSNKGNGIQFTSDLPGVTMQGSTVHYVSADGFGHNGILFIGADGSNDFRGISVSYASTDDNGDGGVNVQAQGNASDIYIGYVQAIHNAGSNMIGSGYGIIVSGANDVVVERSVAGDNGWLPGNHGETGGIEAINDNRVLLQYNEAYDNHHGNSDGDGVILDDTTDSIMQLNYTHDNDGAGLFLFAEVGATSTNNIVRYNISQNDGRQPLFGVNTGILVGGDVSDAEIYNNTVFESPSPASSTVGIVIGGLSDGAAIHVFNNLFVTTGGEPMVAYDGSGTGVLFQGNDYWASGAPIQFLWVGTTYTGLDSWRASTGQETLNGAPVGFAVNPRLRDAGGGGTIGNPDDLDTLTAYQLLTDSPMRNAGLDFGQAGRSWDPYGYASDAFLHTHFNSRPTDFYGDPLPAAGSGLFSIGADQETTIVAARETAFLSLKRT